MIKVSCNEDFCESKNNLLFNASEQKLYKIINCTTSTVHVYEYPVLVSKEISNDVVFVSIKNRQGYLKWGNKPNINNLIKLPMRCKYWSQYIIHETLFERNKYLKWNNDGQQTHFVDFIDDMDYDIEETWLNRAVMSLVSSYMLLKKPDSDKKYYEQFVMEYTKILNGNKCLYLLKNLPHMLHPCVEEHLGEIKHLLNLEDDNDKYLVCL